MEEVHATYKGGAWGWFAVLLAVLDGFPRSRSRPARVSRLKAGTLVRPSA